MPTKRPMTSTEAIRDVLERAGALDEAPRPLPLTTRLRRRLPRTPRRRAGAKRSSLLAVAVLASSAPALPEDAHAEDFRATWASWYGPGFFGNRLACGGTLSWGTRGVAHRTMACGRRLRVCARRCATATVIDRGPFVDTAVREFDVTQALKGAIGLRVGPNGAGRLFVRSAD